MDSDIKTIRELIDRMARTNPEGIFLISPETGRVLTFQGLQEQSRILATYLRETGLEQGERVAFLLDNGLFTAELFLGLMYGGFVSVPLNVRAGVSTLTHTLGHCDAKVVFVGEPYAALIKEVLVNVGREVKVIPASADCFVAAVETSSWSTPLTPPEPEAQALLMYTSGSSGQPKAAMHTHHTVLSHGRNSIDSHQLTSADRSLLVLPFYHINAECVTLIPTLLSGGSIVVPHGFSVSRFWDWLDDHHCTWSAVVPTIISQLLDWKDPLADRRKAAFQRVRFLRSSSAPLSPALHREFLDKFKLLLIQAMGSTEAGNIFSNPLPPAANKIGSPGLPWGFETKILNQEGLEAPGQEPGEVFIRGPGLMQGYYKDPQGTAAVLDRDGWFRTGDIAYRDEQGYFFVVGRSKELIIKGGVNIAPKQIDEVLESHPAVLEAAAVGVPDRYVGEDLLAFVVLRSGNAVEEKELLTFCEDRLGHFKTPTRIHFIKDLPKGPSGKVQRLKLQEKALQRSVSEAFSTERVVQERCDGQASHIGPVEPSTPIEEIIAGTWAKLLSQPKVDVHSNFFSLGGHSLLAIQCLSLLREKLPINLSLSDFFENATVAQQADLMRKRLRPEDGTSARSSVTWEKDLLQKLYSKPANEMIPLRDRSHSCPLSPHQQRIWFLEQLNSGVPVYNESEAVRLRGELNVDVVERALNVIIARHENLRTTIQSVGGEPVAVIHENWPLRLKQIDLSSLPREQREAEVKRLLTDEPRQAYHLDTEPGIRATLLHLGPADHVFILMMHHLICDWSSEGVLWRELSELYRAGCMGQQPALPPLPIQHGDYAVWQHRRLAESDVAAALAYWEENLRHAPALLELPSDRVRPKVNSFNGARQRFVIPTNLVQALRDCSRREKVSLFTVFTAALDVLLHRYTGGEDILVGIPLADRDRPELASMIGFLLHTHALRTRLSGDLSFRDLLGRVQKGVLDLYANRFPPFERVVNRVKAGHNLSYSPVFQVMINWRDRDQELSFIGMKGLEVESLLAETKTAKFDLTLMLTDGIGDMSLEIEYNTDLFDPPRIQRMVGHYQTLLEAVATDPNQGIAKLPLLQEAERQQLLVDWNRTAAEIPKDQCLHELIEEQIARVPEAVAVVFEDKRLTYRQLNERANELAGRLQGMGVGPETLVGICMERSLEMVVGLLGILKAGGAYVPLDPNYPKERLRFMLRDAQPRALLTQRKLLEILPSDETPVICVDGSDETGSGINQESGAKLRIHPHNLAYVLYTSGSTGSPKGVAIEHRSAVALAAWAGQVFTKEEFDGVLFSTSICFDLSVFELFVTLGNGGKVILARNALELPALRAANEVRMINTVPSAVAELVRDGGIPQSVITVNLAGEPLAQSLVDLVYEHPSIRRVFDLYGPTETTTYSTSTLRERGGKATIGRPISNTKIYLLDSHLQPVPIGVPGELLIGGIGLARGYYNRLELTAEKFVSDPFSKEPGARLYKTGDLARYLPNGNIEYLGRLDHQVKIRGFRIELGEIESVLASHPDVREAILIVREDVPGEKRLVAYLIAASGEPPRLSELRSLLQTKLPEYMVPSAFVTLEQFPLTPNGKLDRMALPKPEFAATADKFKPPTTPTEIALAGIWSEALGLEKIGLGDNFFDLGGHSLIAVRVQAQVEKKLQLKLPLALFFQTPTLEQLANELAKSRPAGPESRVAIIQSSGHKPPLFLFHFHFMARSLSMHLGSTRPVHCIESNVAEAFNSWQRGGKVGTTLEHLASHCIKAIRNIQPRGPFHLGGFCFGGNLAFEIASQLGQQGEQVGLLVFLSSYYHAGMRPTGHYLLTRWGHHLRQASIHRSAYLSLKLGGKFMRSKKPHPVSGGDLIFDQETFEPDEQLVLQSSMTRHILNSYIGKPVAARAVLFRGVADPPPIDWKYDWAYGWKEVISEKLHVEDILCGHSEIVAEPWIGEVAKKLQRHLSQFDKDHPPGIEEDQNRPLAI